MGVDLPRYTVAKIADMTIIEQMALPISRGIRCTEKKKPASP
jgi:hypothetical protein